MSNGSIRAASAALRLTIGVSMIACAATSCGPPRAGSAPHPTRPLIFENSGTDPVTVYVTDGRVQWRVGQVEPRRVAVVPLPAAVAQASGRELTLMVVPLGARRHASMTLAGSPDVTRSEPYPAEHLTEMRWLLSGRTLLAVPLSRAGRRRN